MSVRRQERVEVQQGVQRGGRGRGSGLGTDQNRSVSAFRLPRFSLAVLSVLALVGALTLLPSVLSWLSEQAIQTDTNALWAPPSWQHPLGTDGSGRDLGIHLLLGTRVALIVPALTATCTLFLGSALAIGAAFGPSVTRNLCAVLIDALLAFPVLLIAMSLAAALENSVFTVVTALSLGFSAQLARILKTEFLQTLQLDYVRVARIAALPKLRIFFRHILPASLPTIFAYLPLSAGFAILAESSLSYLGFGVSAQTISWGKMLAEMQSAITVFPLAVFWPGCAITLVTFALFWCEHALVRQRKDAKNES